MPPIDPSISLQFRLPQVDNPLQTYNQAQTLRGQMLQNEALERAAADAPRLREMEMMKRQEEQQKRQLDAQKSQGEVTKQQWELLGQLAGSVLNAPPEQQPAAYARARQVGIQAGLPGAQASPEQFTPELIPHLTAILNNAMSSKDTIEQISTTAGQELTAETSRRGQDVDLEVAGMVDARQREANQIADATRRYTAGLPVTPVSIADPKDPNATVVIDARTRQVIGKGPKLTDVGKFEAKRQFNMQGIGATIQAAENILLAVVANQCQLRVESGLR